MFSCLRVSILNLSSSSHFVVCIAALTFQDLGIVPHKLKGYPTEYLIWYRKGGPKFGSTVSERINPEAWP